MDRKALGIYLKSARESAGYSKFGASKALGYISDGTINAVEQGKTSLPIHQIHPIARLYGLNVDELLDRLREYDRIVYERYLKVQEDVISYFARRVAGRRSQRISAEIAMHHFPFSEADKVYIKYILSEPMKTMMQMSLDLRERLLHNNNQGLLVFPHARYRRAKRFYPARNLKLHQLWASA